MRRVVLSIALLATVFVVWWVFAPQDSVVDTADRVAPRVPSVARGPEVRVPIDELRVSRGVTAELQSSGLDDVSNETAVPSEATVTFVVTVGCITSDASRGGVCYVRRAVPPYAEWESPILTVDSPTQVRIESTPLPLGPYEVVVFVSDHLGWRVASRRVVASEGGQLDVRFVDALEAALAVSGRVTTRGVAVPQARVDFEVDWPRWIQSTTDTDEFGRFELSLVRAGRWRATVRTDEGETAAWLDVPNTRSGPTTSRSVAGRSPECSCARERGPSR